MIPKCLYHIWLSNQGENALQKSCVASWETLGYDIVPITLENCPRTSEFVKKALSTESKVGWCKANDYLRIQLLYERGGVYLDNDVEVIRSLDPLLDSNCFMAAEDGTLVNQAVIGSEAGNPILKQWLDECEKHDPSSEESPVFTLQLMTVILKELGWKANEDFVSENVHVYTSDYFYPSHWKTKDAVEITENTRTIHHWEGSWQNH